MKIRVLSLFDGISVGMLALKRAGFDVEKYYASEIKTKAMKCSFNNWGDAIEQIGDVRKVDGKKYDVDIIIGGSPCQNFSRARTSHCNVIDGLAGEQSSLFFEYLRILKENNPKYFFLENVWMPIDDQKIINRLLGVEPIRANSSLVSYQQRDRLYWTNIPGIELPKDRHINFQDYKDTDEEYCDKFIVNRTPSRERMWGDGNGECPNVTNREKINCITLKQDRWKNSGLIAYKDFCRYLTTRELEIGQTLPVGYTKGLSKKRGRGCHRRCMDCGHDCTLFWVLKKRYGKETGGNEMKIIAVMSPKGGIGKTTTSDSIAYMLGEEQGKRVLVLDGDPQGDTSKTFGVYEPDGIGMSELLEKHECVGGTYKTGDLIRPTDYSHIDIIPANGYLMKTDMNLLLKSEDNQVTRMREALEEVSGAYDYCVCDCGRLLDMVVINILIAAELVIAPVKVGGYEIEALQNLEEQIEDLRDINPDLRIKALMTMRQKNKTSLEVEEWLKAESGFDMFVTPIRRSIIAEKSTTAMIPLPKFSKRGIVSQDYRCVVHELLKEMEG